MPTSRSSAVTTTATHATRRSELITLMVFVFERPVKPRVPVTRQETDDDDAKSRL